MKKLKLNPLTKKELDELRGGITMDNAMNVVNSMSDEQEQHTISNLGGVIQCEDGYLVYDDYCECWKQRQTPYL
jgi:hypothetical protein